MAADDLSLAPVPALVELMYRADWTSMGLVLEVAEFDDYAARSRMLASRQPPWLREAGPFPNRGGHWIPPDPVQESDDDDEDDEDDEDAFQPQHERAYRLLIAPGGRFRADDGSAGHFAGSDGQPGHEALPPGHDLLLPAWLPARFELELAGAVVLNGRRAYRLIGRPRPVGAGRRSRPGQYQLTPPHRQRAAWSLEGIDRIDAMLDAELGILLRCEQIHRGQVVRRSEITAITAGPAAAADAAEFSAPPEDEPGDGSLFTGPGWERAKTVANAGATALSFAIRHAPHREPPAGSKAGAPPSDPHPDQADGSWPGPPGPGDPLAGPVIRLLYEAGLKRTTFDAELRTWADTAADAEALRSAAARNPSMPGVIKLGQTLGERATSWQGRDAIRVGLPDMYRVDYIDGGQKTRKVASEACDGAQRWRLFAGHVSTGAARPLPDFIARLADPSWLLEWQLTGGAEITEQGRPAYLVRVRPSGPAPDSAAAHDYATLADAPTEVVVDAETGIVVRLRQEKAGRPSMQQVLAGLTTRPRAGAGGFRMEIPPGIRVVRDSGTVLDEAATSASAQTALSLTVRGLSAAARLGSFLHSVREPGQRSGPGQG